MKSLIKLLIRYVKLISLDGEREVHGNEWRGIIKNRWSPSSKLADQNRFATSLTAAINVNRPVNCIAFHRDSSRSTVN